MESKRRRSKKVTNEQRKNEGIMKNKKKHTKKERMRDNKGHEGR
jgi:hypothetical protein